MDQRLEFHNLLKDTTGIDNIYFQPPSSRTIKYPAVIYNLGDYWDVYADNQLYKTKTTYTVTLIHRDPDNDIVEKIRRIPFAVFDRFFTNEGLNHYVFRINY